MSGNNCLGNLRDGVFVNRGSVSHTVVENLITCNGRNGVNIPNFVTNDPGIRIEVTNNSIYGNTALGIDLGNAGITPNTLDGLPRNGEANFALEPSSRRFKFLRRLSDVRRHRIRNIFQH